MGSPGERDWPFTGRADDVRAVLSMLGLGGVVLVGDAGVGKTRLLREILAAWTSTGGATEWVVATRAARSIPFGAVSHLLVAGTRPADDPTLLAGAVASRFAGTDSRLLVGIDDAHLLDDGSAALLHQLTVRGLLVPVASIRPGEPVPDAVTAMWKDTGSWVSLGPLPPQAVDELLGHAVPGPLDPISRRRLCRLAAGNPLLLREFLADALDTGALRQWGGMYRWCGPASVSPRLAELLAARLRTLDPATRDAVETIACGEPLALPLLERLVGPAAVEAAERSGMAVAQRSGARTEVRLAHPLYGEVLRASLPASRAREIWRRLAESLATCPMRRSDDPLLAGVWQLRSGVAGCPTALLTAAEHALSRCDLDLAERLARAARSAGHGREADQLLADILIRRGRGQEALEVLPDTPPPGGEQLANWAVTRASILYWGLGRVEEAERVLRAAAGTPLETAGWELAEAMRSVILLFDGRCQAALDAAELVISHAHPDPRAVALAATSGTTAAGMLGRLTRTTDLAERGKAAAGTDLPLARAQIGFGTCCALRATGRLVAARTLADDGYRAAVASESVELTAIWAALRGMVAKAQGRLGIARAALSEAIALATEADPCRILPPCLAELAGVAALGGDAATARNLIARAEDLKLPANRLYDAWIELDRAWVHAAEGALSEAVETTHRAAKLAGDSEQPTLEAIALYDAARLGAAPLVRERLDALARHIEGGVVRTLAAAASALVSHDATALEQAAHDLATSGHLLLAAELHTTAAHALRRAGLNVRAHLATGRAAAILAGDCRGARTPLLDLSGPCAALTRREREIARLATTLLSRQIADRLGLSVHTVNNTLARAYAKLGVRNRRDLIGLFQAVDPPTR